MTITRRNLVLGASAASMSALPISAAFGQAKAEFTLKYGNNLPIAHPMNVRATEMAVKINSESKGRIALEVYPNNQLGNDTDMLSQVRSGAMDYFTLSPLILGTLVPAAQISGVGFACWSGLRPNQDRVHAQARQQPACGPPHECARH